MFGSKKTQLLSDGAQALAVITDVSYAKVAGMTIARNYNYKLDLTLMVRPDDGPYFEAHVSDYFSQYAQPSVGDQLRVRYDPEDHSRIEIDNAAVEAGVAAQAANALPPDLALGGILGRGAIVDVQKIAAGAFIDCALTIGVRLVDGTDPYRAGCHIALMPEQADQLVPGGTFVTVRADPHDHSRIAVSLGEETPVVTINDPRALDPATRALRDGLPCRVTVLLHQRQWLKTPDDEELYAIKVRVQSDGAEFQVNLPVPAAALDLLRDGAELPARRIAAEPNVLAIDWASAPSRLRSGDVDVTHEKDIGNGVGSRCGSGRAVCGAGRERGDDHRDQLGRFGPGHVAGRGDRGSFGRHDRAAGRHDLIDERDTDDARQPDDPGAGRRFDGDRRQRGQRNPVHGVPARRQRRHPRRWKGQRSGRCDLFGVHADSDR
jgi:hypothetical protein